MLQGGRDVIRSAARADNVPSTGSVGKADPVPSLPEIEAGLKWDSDPERRAYWKRELAQLFPASVEEIAA